MVFKIQNVQAHLYFVTAKIEDGKYLFMIPLRGRKGGAQ